MRLYLALSGLTLGLSTTACGAPAGEDSAGPVAEAPSADRPASVTEAELIGRGETIAQTLCSGCHAVARGDESAHPQAPALRTLNHNYPVEALAEPLAEGIVVGHPHMPEWQFEEADIDALLAYLETIQVPPRI